MSAVDLVILGHLINGSMSAYDLKKELENQNAGNWLKISIPSVYKNLLKLHEKNFLDSRTVKDTEMPEKTIYTINESGILHFSNLMKKYSSELNNIYFDFNAFVSNLDKLGAEEALLMIGNLREQFNLKKQQMEKVMQYRSNLPFKSFAIIRLYNDLFVLLYNWTSDLYNEYTK